MMKARILTGWAGAGTQGNPWRPAVADAYAFKTCTELGWNDPTQGGTFTVDAVLDDATLALLEADPDYTVLSSTPYGQ